MCKTPCVLFFCEKILDWVWKAWGLKSLGKASSDMAFLASFDTYGVATAAAFHLTERSFTKSMKRTNALSIFCRFPLSERSGKLEVPPPVKPGGGQLCSFYPPLLYLCTAERCLAMARYSLLLHMVGKTYIPFIFNAFPFCPEIWR